MGILKKIEIFTDSPVDIHILSTIKSHQTCTNGVTQKGSLVPNDIPLRIPKNQLEKVKQNTRCEGHSAKKFVTKHH